MEFTNMELLNMKGPLQELVKSKFPAKTSLELVRMVRAINEKLIPVEEVRDKLVREYGTNDGSGNIGLKPGDANWEQFNEEFGEIIQETVEIATKPVFIPGTVEVEPAVVMILERLIRIAE